jgi:hypothetical protein
MQSQPLPPANRRSRSRFPRSALPAACVVLVLGLAAAIAGGEPAPTAPTAGTAIYGLAPGRVVGGATVTLYGNGFTSEKTITLEGPYPVSAVRMPGSRPSTRGHPHVLSASRNEFGTAMWFTAPLDAEPGAYTARPSGFPTGVAAAWFIVEPRVKENTVANGRRVALPLVSGQTVIGTLQGSSTPLDWLADFDLYYLVGGKGATVTLTMERVDTSKTWEHPESLDPQIDVAGRDGFVYDNLSGVDNRPSVDLNASITSAVLPEDGLYLVIAGTTRGRGKYRLSFVQESYAPVNEGDRLLPIEGAIGTSVQGQWSPIGALALDPRGAPLSGARVEFRPANSSGRDVGAEFENGPKAVTNVDGMVFKQMRVTGLGIVSIEPRFVDVFPSALVIPGVRVPRDVVRGPRDFHEPVAMATHMAVGSQGDGTIAFALARGQRLKTERRFYRRPGHP